MNAYLIRALTFGPEILGELIHRISPEKVDTKADPARFSPREVIAHMADWEPIFLGRLQQAVNEPGSTIIGIDEGVRSIEVGYATKDIKESIAGFRANRAKTLEFLNSLTKEQWTSKFLHSELGEISVYDYANTMGSHDVYHIEQLLHY